jgi:hypothetical protein
VADDLLTVDLRTLDTNDLLDYLASLAERIAAVEDERTRLYAVRLAVYQEARDRTPPITQRALAERAGVSEPSVIQALKAARIKAAG